MHIKITPSTHKENWQKWTKTSSSVAVGPYSTLHYTELTLRVTQGHWEAAENAGWTIMIIKNTSWVVHRGVTSDVYNSAVQFVMHQLRWCWFYILTCTIFCPWFHFRKFVLLCSSCFFSVLNNWVTLGTITADRKIDVSLLISLTPMP